MDQPDLRSGKPAPEGRPRSQYGRGAASLCRHFMENEGWAQLFAIAKGEPQAAWVKGGGFASHKTRRLVVTPDFDTRIAAYRLVTSYGYGKPAELADPDTGRTVTDLLLAALDRQPGRGPSEEVA